MSSRPAIFFLKTQTLDAARLWAVGRPGLWFLPASPRDDEGPAVQPAALLFLLRSDVVRSPGSTETDGDEFLRGRGLHPSSSLTQQQQHQQQQLHQGEALASQDAKQPLGAERQQPGESR